MGRKLSASATGSELQGAPKSVLQITLALESFIGCWYLSIRFIVHPANKAYKNSASKLFNDDDDDFF